MVTKAEGIAGEVKRVLGMKGRKQGCQTVQRQWIGENLLDGLDGQSRGRGTEVRAYR
jgi:hypothetical protein